MQEYGSHATVAVLGSIERHPQPSERYFQWARAVVGTSSTPLYRQNLMDKVLCNLLNAPADARDWVRTPDPNKFVQNNAIILEGK